MGLRTLLLRKLSLLSLFPSLLLASLVSIALLTGGSVWALDARDFNRQGIQLQSEGKLKEAVECYRKAIVLNPGAGGAGYHNNLALALKDLGDLPSAEAEARLALRYRPKRADYHFNLGIILQKEKKYIDAEQSFRSAIALDSTDTEFHFRLGQVLLQQEALDRAEEEAKLALLLKPDNGDYNELLGDIYLRQKKLDNALNQYKQVCANRGYTAATVPGDLKAKIDLARSGMDSSNTAR